MSHVNEHRSLKVELFYVYIFDYIFDFLFNRIIFLLLCGDLHLFILYKIYMIMSSGGKASSIIIGIIAAIVIIAILIFLVNVLAPIIVGIIIFIIIIAVAYWVYQQLRSRG
ncbi:MAG: hypothetical protein E6K94_11300 [Thaumarchaeota archaeon]|nr:MAG: hypothetical protein E6K94_11300 [Nitrososphaerota archaeon]